MLLHKATILMRLVVLSAVGPTLSACVLSGGGMEDMVDRETITQSISRAPSAPAVEPDQASDQKTVKNAVSALDMATAETRPTAWANTETGASGVITAIQEVRAGDMICRTFKTSRQRFDGVALYDGEACTKGQGDWTLTRFNEGS